MNWLLYPLLSAIFAGLVAIFGKIGDASRIAPVDRLSVLFVIIFGVFLLGGKTDLGAQPSAVCLSSSVRL